MRIFCFGLFLSVREGRGGVPSTLTGCLSAAFQFWIDRNRLHSSWVLNGGEHSISRSCVVLWQKSFWISCKANNVCWLRTAIYIIDDNKSGRIGWNSQIRNQNCFSCSLWKKILIYFTLHSKHNKSSNGFIKIYP